MTTMIQLGKRTIERFDGKDYTIWALQMKNMLRERKLVKYIDDAITNATEGYIKVDDEQAQAEIQFMMDNTQIKLIIYCTMACEAWTRL